jgi:DNA sulfur modification protein DndB
MSIAEPRRSLPFLTTMLTEQSHLAREYRKRRREFDTRPVSLKRADELLAAGWERERKLRKRIRFRRVKGHDERLENRLWCLLYKFGYHELNEGRQFKVLVRRKGADDLQKQLDVLGKDDETVVVAECKSQESLKKKSLQKDIEEFASLKGPIASSIKSHYGAEFKPKILWLFVTDNIIWSDSDIQRAAGNSIIRITERELRYFSELANHLGHAGRYQFLAEYLEGQRIPELENRRIPAIKGKLGGRHYYSFVTTPEHLLKIAFVNHRSLNDPDGVPTYQRLVQKGRIKKIARFIEGGGFFPTNLLVNFKRKVRFDTLESDDETGVKYGYLYLPDRYKSAWIIDGQHRLYGYSGLDEASRRQNLLVAAFEDLEIKEEADLFVTINHEQKSVPRNLLDDLEGDLKWGSAVPSEKIGSVAARLIAMLNADAGEPFYNRVTAQGIRATAHTCLTVPAIKQGLRRSGVLGTAIIKKKLYQPGALAGATDLNRGRSRKSASAAQAARFIYLNRTCFNGIYRVNVSGNFNVPYGKGSDALFPTKDHLRFVAGLLRRSQLLTASFEQPLEKARAGDLVYLDPPYPPLNGTSFFRHYTPGRFGDKDQLRVRDVAVSLAERGCHVMVSNADTKSIRNMYADFNVRPLKVTRFVSSRGTKHRVDEIIITNYGLQH